MSKPFLPRRPMLVGAALLVVASMAIAASPSATTVPRYDGKDLRLPADYRQWIYLTTSFDMSYDTSAPPDHHLFDNVFVDPASYRAFLKTGTWPDKTMLVREVRGTGSQPSISRAGHFQDTALMELEVHVKDASRFPGQWAFFAFDEGKPTAALIPRSADCYSCHADHAAVDTTFVQFYPTLRPVATAKGTMKADTDR